MDLLKIKIFQIKIILCRKKHEFHISIFRSKPHNILPNNSREQPLIENVPLKHIYLLPELDTAVFVNMKCGVSEIVLTSLHTPEVRKDCW